MEKDVGGRCIKKPTITHLSVVSMNRSKGQRSVASLIDRIYKNENAGKCCVRKNGSLFTNDSDMHEQRSISKSCLSFAMLRLRL